MLHDLKLVELELRNFTHLHTLFSVRTHPDVSKYLRGPPPHSFTEHIAYLTRLGTNKKFYLVELQSSCCFSIDSSFCGYFQLTYSDESIEMGIALSPKFSNKGIGSKAMSLLLTMLTQDEKAKDKSLILFVKADNPRAIALYKKHGFMCSEHINEYGEFLMRRNLS